MGRLIRAHDWSLSPLGPPSEWPQSLKTALSICLGSKFPMVIWWGRDLRVFYNDAYIPISGELKHPMFLGRPAQEQWPEIWDVVGALARDVLETGNATWSEDQPLYIARSGFVEECYFTCSFSPAREESGAVGGMFCAVQEMTGRVIGERRLRVLRALGAEEFHSFEQVAVSAARVLGTGPNDAPFALVYLTTPDGERAELVGASGLAKGARAAPAVIELSADRTHWPLSRVNELRRPERVDGLRERFSDELPKVPYEELPDSAVVLPIELAAHAAPAGFLVLGLNLRLEYNDTYEGFFQLVRKQITSHLSNVRALQEEKERTVALAEIDRAKTAFFGNISHEFRTPLTLMLGPIEEMLSGRKGELSPELRAEADVAHRNALRLLKLVNALLDFSRIEAGRVDAIYEPVDLAAATADWDRFRIEQVLTNLLTNASRYGQGKPIDVGLRQRGAEAELSVADLGSGIAQVDQERIFTRFERAISPSEVSGLGLGLYIARQIVEAHHGTIRVESTLGEGSRFIVTLPLSPAAL